MGMEQGGYTTDAGGDDQGSYGYGGGGDFNLSMGGGGDSFAIDYAADYGGASDFTGDYSGFDEYDFLGFGFEAATSGGDLPFYQGPSFEDIPLGYAPSLSEIAAMDVPIAIGSESCAERWSPGCEVAMQSMFDPWQWAYTPIFPDLPPPLPPVVTPLIPLTVQPPPQTPLPQTPLPGPQPIAPGLPPACPTGQYHPYPIGHPEQNKCVPFPPMQTTSSPQPRPQPATGGGGGSSTQKPPAQQQACPTGYCKHPQTGQCIPIPAGYTRHPQTQVCTAAQQQQQKCPTGYYPVGNQCLPIPKCTTPGTVFDQARGLCVPINQAISPLPESGELDDLLGSLKEIPWWLWVALLGAFVLSQGGEESKRVTVQHRRAR